jgi:predicted permease
LLAKLTNLLRHQRAEQEMNREISSHLALLQDEFERQGLSAEQARKAARRAYGGVEQSKELHRAERSILWIEQMAQDLRHACRGLLKSPVFLTIALLSLGFGMGLNTAIFTLVNGILLKRLPVADPDRTVLLGAQMDNFESPAFSFPAFRELHRQDSIFDDSVGSSSRSAILEVDDQPKKVDCELVTGTYFQFFHTRPALGRLLDEEDDRVEGAHPVCVISYVCWQTDFGRDSRVLDRTIRIDGVPIQIVGVLEPTFVGAELQHRYDLWLPTSMSADLGTSRESPNRVWLHILARLRPGVTLREAASRLESASPSIEDLLPKDRANAGAIYKIHDGSKGFSYQRSILREPLSVLMGAVILVLLVACVNLANLLLARATERHQEFAIKLSLGISRWRLIRQLMLESFLLAVAGGVLAILLSFVLTRALLDLFNAGSRFGTIHVTPDRTVLLFALGLCILTALITGLYPALHASRADTSAALKGASLYGLRRSLVRRTLIVVQVTLAVVLLFGASLHAHSLAKLKTVDLGYDISQVLTVDIAPRGPRKNRTPAATPADFDDILDRVRSMQGVDSAAFSEPGVLSGSSMTSDIKITGKSGEVRQIENVHYLFASPGYLSTMRIPLLQGRDFEAADREGSLAVGMVNERLASQLWPGENPIGKHLNGWSTKTTPELEVIGLVGNTKYTDVREKTEPVVYQPLDQGGMTSGALEVRCRGALAPLEAGIRAMIRSFAPDYEISNAASMVLMRDNIIAQDRLLAFLSSLFGTLGTVLALIGIYGLISYSVSRRTREVGVRMSIGARSIDVLWLFLREVTILLGVGLLIGLPLAIGLARFLQGMLFEVSTSDPLGISTTVAMLALGGLLASFFPARRATRINPVHALRYE